MSKQDFVFMSAEQARAKADESNKPPAFREQVVDWLVTETMRSICKAATAGGYSIGLDDVPTIRTPVTDADRAEVQRRIAAMGYEYLPNVRRIAWHLPARGQS